jgi:hypothetical protein
LEGASFGAAVLKRKLAVRTEWRLLSSGLGPGGGRAGQGQIFEQARAQAIEARIELVLDLAQAGFGMEKAPLAHLTGDFGR